MKMGLPKRFRTILQGSDKEGGVSAFAADIWRILKDNKVQFFPAYTDHGIDHVERVLEAIVTLVPEDVWTSDLLKSADAAALVTAALLHDIGLHIREGGFDELIAPNSRFSPLPWFDQQQGARHADLPWSDAWEKFRIEARHFTVTQLDRILGPGNDGLPAVAVGENDRHPERWTLGDHLLIGEFLRRHHARLSHEIAVHGFPGVPRAEFPPLAERLGGAGDVAGAIARSHNESLRTMGSYFTDEFGRAPRPRGVFVHYAMALLRVADYLQLDSDRAPLLLLRLKAPQSPVSLDEWAKHQAIEDISWDRHDPHAIFVTVSSDHGLRTHLQLRELFHDLQRELDISAAVLSETYSLSSPQAKLTLERVHTNLDDPSLHRRLPFVPRRAALRSSEDLFRLVIRSLYGDEPAVAGRELLQNAVDAFRERNRCVGNNQLDPPTETFAGHEDDVVVEIREHPGGTLELRVADGGIGMTPTTIIDYFLQAGASLRPSVDGTNEGRAEKGRVTRWMKAGRFGVGAFAAFLLGDEVKVRTRHLEAERGVEFTARMDEDVIELDWADDLPFGTEVRVRFRGAILPPPERPIGSDTADPVVSLLTRIANYYQLNTPRIRFTVVREDGTSLAVRSERAIPDPAEPLPPDWRSLENEDFEAVLWSPRPSAGRSFLMPSNQGGVVVHNGIVLSEPFEEYGVSTSYEFREEGLRDLVASPPLAIFDPLHRLPITLNRYGLAQRHVGFEDRLLEAIGYDIVAHSLVEGISVHPLGHGAGLTPVYGRASWIPYLPDLLPLIAPSPLCVLWGQGTEDMVELESDCARDFLAEDGEMWDQLPWRLVLPLPFSFGEGIEQQLWGTTLSETEEALREFTKIGKLKLESAVLARRLSSPTRLEELPDELNYALTESERWTSWRRRSLSSLDDSVEYFWQSSTSPTVGIELLTSMAHALLKGSYDDSVMLAIVRPSSATSDIEASHTNTSLANVGPIARPWTRLIGGALEEDEQSRRQRTLQICNEDDEVRMGVESWERRVAQNRDDRRSRLSET